MKFKLGVLGESFRLPLEESLKAAKELGLEGIQLFATAPSGELDPDNLSPARRKEIRKLVADLGMEISAVCGDLGGHGFALEKDNGWKVKKSKEILDLAVDLSSNVVTTHIGVIPEDKESDRYRAMHAACTELAAYAHSKDAYFAIETGPEIATTLRDFLDSLPTKGVAVNLDPANFVMVTGDDPVEAVHTLRDYIVHTHAKDGRMLKKVDPVAFYNTFAEGGIEDPDLFHSCEEVPLGEGAVDWPAYLDALDQIGYHGYLTIEREVGGNPAADIRKAAEFLRALLQ